MIRGIETTEFWGTVLMHVITLLTLFGVTTHFTSEQVQAVATVAALIGSAVAQAVYTHSRQVIKTQPAPLTGELLSTVPNTAASPPMVSNMQSSMTGGTWISGPLPANEAGPAPSAT